MDQSKDAYERGQPIHVLTGQRSHWRLPEGAGTAKSAATMNAPPAGGGNGVELDRIRARRGFVNVDQDAHVAKPWGLALSGGGIRSATFCLGVLQALAQAPFNARHRSLARFDHLSTVSGGGYIGGFLVSLFMKDRLVEKTDEKQAAANASAVLQTNPPLRLHRKTVDPHATAEHFPLGWLRENGRYLTPNGAGDLFFAAAVGIRNFCAVHYVIATVVMTTFLLSQVLQATLQTQLPNGSSYPTWINSFFPPIAPDEACNKVVKVAVDASAALKATVVNDTNCKQLTGTFAWLSLWWLPALFGLGAFAVPIGVAYWIVHPGRGGSTTDAAKFWTEGAFGYIAVMVLLTLIIYFQMPEVLAKPLSKWTWPLASAIVTVAICGAALFWHALAVLAVRRAASVSPESDAATVTQERRRLSLWLETAMVITLTITVGAALETVAQTAYLRLAADHQTALALSATAYAALAWLTHKAIVFFNEKTEASFLRKLPLPVILNVLGIAAALILTCIWAGVAVTFRCADASCSTQTSLAVLWPLVLFGCFVAVLSGLFPGFVNLSTWHAFYSTRLRRAYLGASNQARFKDPNLSVVETHKGDEPKADQYRAASGAPLHLINVCVNETMGAGGQLVQRDRKGKNLCVGPFGYTIDDEFYSFPPRGGSADASPDLAISEWVGVSGAAFSTGLGRQSSLGSSMLLGFANVRLGRWWPSYASVERKQDVSLATRVWRNVLQSQQYLFRELTARFPGNDREWLYLSDGGHFENTALYELLRPERSIRFVVVCDNGCDAKYEFDDLANAIRLARIDHGVELEVDTVALNDPLLSPYLATPSELRAALVSEALPGKRTNRCAVLLKATHTDWANQPTHILLIKPRLIAAVPEDVLQYAQTHPDFPQQTTANQFFDEAQWESYRKLGLCAGNLLFGDDTHPSAFWSRLQHYVTP